MNARGKLRIVKTLHTVVWALFAGCIVAIPVCVLQHRFDWAFGLIALVFAEVAVLVLNSWSCPLTAVAASYTDDRRDNFDIYLPVWLARHNKLIFGVFFAAGVAFALLRWCSV